MKRRLVVVMLWSIPLCGVALGLVAYVRALTVMPGQSFRGKLPEFTEEEQALAERLRADVVMLASTIGERNYVQYRALAESMEYVESRFQHGGLGPRREVYESGGQAFANVVVEISGGAGAEQVLVVGAHYDSAVGSPGANDNGTGVAALLALAERFRDHELRRTLRFVAFVNEEPPHFHTEAMGSLVHARGAAARGENIVGMLALETMGFYSDARGSQHYPPPLAWMYPTQGDFIGFVGNTESRAFLREAMGSFRAHTAFPSEGAALPGSTSGAGWSDHWSFWQEGFPGLMVTDTAPFRYPHYHTAEDTPERVDYPRLARVVLGLEKVLRDLAR